MREGAEIHVTCVNSPSVEDPKAKRLWRIYAQVDDHTKVLVSTRSGEPKDHKSADVLLNFADMVGIIHWNIPRNKGEVEKLTLKDFDFSKATLASEANK